MSDLFNIYEDSLNGLLNRIRNVTDTFNNLSKGKIPQLIKDKAEYALIEANNSIKDADRLVKSKVKLR